MTLKAIRLSRSVEPFARIMACSILQRPLKRDYCREMLPDTARQPLDFFTLQKDSENEEIYGNVPEHGSLGAYADQYADGFFQLLA